MIEILNKTCKLKTENGITFTGFFYMPNKNVRFDLLADSTESKALIRKVFSEGGSLPQLCGCVNGIEVTIIGAWLAKVAGISPEKDIAGKLFIHYLVIGTATFDEIKTEYLSAEMPALRHFCRISLFENFPIIDTVNIAEKVELQAQSKDATLAICASVRVNASFTEKIELKPEYSVSVSYNAQVKLSEAVKELFQFRKFLCVIADYGVNLASTFYFNYGNTNLPANIPNCALYLNDMEMFDEPDVPFRIRHGNVAENFADTYNKWRSFAESNRPFVDVYYDIIGKYTRGINRFLRIESIVVSYSERYRNNKANAVKNEYRNGNDNIGERYRYIDMLREYGSLLPITNYPDIITNDVVDNAKVYAVCGDIKWFRDYYVHYGAEKEKKSSKDNTKKNLIDNRKYIEYANMLYLVIMAAVYREIGFPDNDIKEALRGGERGRFGNALIDMFDGVLKRGD
jgi:hypothetical protein